MKRIFSRLISLLCLAIFLAAAFLPAFAMAQAASPFTADMVKRGLVSVGNTQRFHAVVDKARSGEPITIVAIGGSITEGAAAVPQKTACYAALSADAFASRYMPDPALLRFVNSGISGTPSLLGITRLEQDVLRYDPDIVFVEFAVNDSQDLTSQGAYESLIRRLLQADSQPAVILLFTVLSGGYSAQPHMSKIGAHYDLGMISVGDAITPALSDGSLLWSDYSADYAHPNTAGHAFIAQMVANYYDSALAVPAEPFQLPAKSLVGNYLDQLRNITSGDPAILSEGDFPFASHSCYTYRSGFVHSPADSAQPLTFISDGCYLSLAFRQENKSTFGVAEVWVDGALKTTLSGSDPSAWGNIATKLIHIGRNTPHTVEIRMQPGDENKYFVLLDIAIAP